MPIKQNTDNNAKILAQNLQFLIPPTMHHNTQKVC